MTRPKLVRVDQKTNYNHVRQNSFKACGIWYCTYAMVNIGGNVESVAQVEPCRVYASSGLLLPVYHTN